MILKKNQQMKKYPAANILTTVNIRFIVGDWTDTIFFVGLPHAVIIALVSYTLSGDFWVTFWAWFGNINLQRNQPSPSKLGGTQRTKPQNQNAGPHSSSVKCLTADPGVASLIQTQSHTFMGIDHEIISTAILLPSADSRRVVVSYKWKYVHKVLVNCLLVKLAHEKSVVMGIDSPNMTIAVDLDVKH